MNALADLQVKIFADGAEKEGILKLYANPIIRGLTTNPTLMRKAGISDYESFAREVLETVTEKPISLEVFSDELPEMRRQALKISRWQGNVYVKIPITNTQRESTTMLIHDLVREGVKVNVTALLTLDQVQSVSRALLPDLPAVVSLFCGRIADTGRDPILVVKESLKILQSLPLTELLWASCREILNIHHADQSGAHIITVGHEILAKAISQWGKDLTDLSLETVEMFYRDALAAGYQL